MPKSVTKRVPKVPKHFPNKPAWVRRLAEAILTTRFNEAFVCEEIGDVIMAHVRRQRMRENSYSRRAVAQQAISESV